MKIVSIIIVSYNTKNLTLACLKSIYEQTKNCSFQIVLIDNNSSDGSADAIASEFPQVNLIRLQENIGFARANNLAAQQASGKYILLLNPDTVILDNAIEKLLSFAKENKNAGIWGGRTLFADGSLNPTSCWRQTTLWSLFCRALHLSALFPALELFNPESYGAWQRDKVREVDIVSGCFFLIENTVWQQLNGFDSAFFMYGEEADLCWRAKTLGYRPIVTPEATIIHYGGKSEKVFSDKIIKLMVAKVLLMNKHWSKTSAFIGKFLLLFWMSSKIIAMSILCLFKPQLNESLDSWKTAFKNKNFWLKAQYIQK